MRPSAAPTALLTTSFCGCRPCCKSFLPFCACDRMRTSVRPLGAAISEAAGRYGDPRIGSKSHRRALSPIACSWFSRSRSVRSFCPFGSSLSHTSRTGIMPMDAFRPSCGASRCRISVILLLRQHCPDHTRHLVGERNRHEHLRLARAQPVDPRPFSDPI